MPASHGHVSPQDGRSDAGASPITGSTDAAPTGARSPAGAAMSAARRGRHKGFLGMAAGVGKTYRMLQEGQAEAESGRDVAIGYLEAHGRAETTAVAEG